MTLLDKQIKAVQEAKEQCVGEALNDIGHNWHFGNCVLCNVFVNENGCNNCPLAQWSEKDWDGCIRLKNFSPEYLTPQDLASFLYSLELYLRERRHE